MIDEPEPGSTEVAAVAVAARAVELRAVEGVVAGELVAHLVRHVVDGVEVADRRREAGAALALLLPPTTPRLATPPPVWPSADVADVVVGRADDLADHDPVAGSVAPAQVGAAPS